MIKNQAEDLNIYRNIYVCACDLFNHYNKEILPCIVTNQS